MPSEAEDIAITKYQMAVMFLPNFLAGVHASAGQADRVIILGALAVAIAFWFYIDRQNLKKEDRTGLLGAVMLGGSIGLAGMSAGYLLGTFVDYIQSF